MAGDLGAAGPRPRVAVAALIHESNAFAADRTEISAFLRLDGASVGAMARTSGTEVGGALLGLDEAGAEAVPTSVAWAQSSGLVADGAVRELSEELVAGLAAQLDAGLDGVVLCLHGSMGSPSEPDVEGRVLREVRRLVGPEVAVVATLDWHCSITDPMVVGADALVAYRTYPHIDQEARGRDAAHLAVDRIRGSRLDSTVVRLPLLVAGPATRDSHPAMASILQVAQDLAAADDAIATWSVCPGFARSDAPASSASVYAASGAGRAAAERFCRSVAARWWESRRAFAPVTASVEQALGAATEAASRPGTLPLVLSDQGDNPGGGADGTSTVLLDALRSKRVDGALVASLCAPDAVAACRGGGNGATVTVLVGDATMQVKVVAVSDGRYVMQSPTHPNLEVDVGPLARVLTAEGVEVVLTSTPVQNEDLQLLESLDIEVTAHPVVVVKSNAHFRAAFEPVASRVIDVDTPGLSTPHLERLPYRRIRRPVFPLDPDLDWSPDGGS